MSQHADILDSRESIRGAFVGAIALHVSIVAAVLISGWIAAHSDTFGAKDAGGAAVGIEAVNSIPLPHRGMQNPVANDTESRDAAGARQDRRSGERGEASDPMRSRSR